MKILVFVFLQVFCFLGLAGGEITSTGGEFITTEKNPWYVGEKSVTYCVMSSSDFSVDFKKAKKITEEVILDWTTSLKKMNLWETRFNLPDGKPKNITTEFIYEKCQESTELKFLFGVFNKDIETTLKTKSRYTAAFAGHLGIDDFNGRVKKGFVWFVPDRGPRKYIGPKLTSDFWSASHVFRNVLLHEIGHVFGFGHHPDGIMNEGYPGFTVQFGGLKSSSEELLDHKWPYITTKACNNEVAIDINVARSLLKTNLIILWDICIETEEVQYESMNFSDIVFSELRLSFVSEKSIVEKTFRFNITGASGFSNSLSRSVVGKYFANKIKGPAEYQDNYFLSFFDTRFMGELEDIETGEKIPGFLAKHGNTIELNYTVEKKGYSLSFDLGKLPKKLEAIKNRLDNK